MKIKLNDLKKLGKDINSQEVFEEDIDVKVAQDVLETAILEAVVDMDAEELAGLSEASTATLEALQGNQAEPEKPAKKEKAEKPAKEVKAEKPAKTEKPAKEASDSQENDIEYIRDIMSDVEDVKELHTLIKQNSCFVNIRMGIHLQKDADKVLVKMETELKAWKKGGSKAAPKAEKPAKPAKEVKEKTISAYGFSIELLCSDPDMSFEDVEKAAEKAGIDIVDKKSALRTGFGAVNSIVKRLRANKLMK